MYYVCVCMSQPGPGTACCVCRSWASTTWRSCQLICLMTPCTSARPLMPPWDPEGPNSPSSVRLCASGHVDRKRVRCCVSLTVSPLSLQSPLMTQWSMGVRRCCWTRGSPTTWAACLEGLNHLPWSSGLKTVCLWRGPPAPPWVWNRGRVHRGRPSKCVFTVSVFHLCCKSVIHHLSAVHHQEVLPDRKRVTTRSYLPIAPVDSDTGRNYSCVASNLAVPTGKSTTVTLNVHRKHFNAIKATADFCLEKCFSSHKNCEKNTR